MEVIKENSHSYLGSERVNIVCYFDYDRRGDSIIRTEWSGFDHSSIFGTLDRFRTTYTSNANGKNYF